MRFTLVSLAVLLANSLAPGVHGAPAAVSVHAGPLAVPRDLGTAVDDLLGTVTSIIAALLGGLGVITPQQANQLVQQILVDLPARLDASTGISAQAASASDPASTAPSTSTPGTIGASAVASSRSPVFSSGAPSRMVRQLPTTPALPFTPSAPIPSLVPTGKLSSTASKSGAGRPTSSSSASLSHA